MAESGVVDDKVLDDDVVSRCNTLLDAASKPLPHYTVGLRLELAVFDPRRKKELTLLKTSLSGGEDGPRYRTHDDGSIGRYLVEGEVFEVPHEYCPSCRGPWDFNLTHRTCPDRGISLGKEVKLLVDANICPNCENGTVTSESPECTKCDFEAVPEVIWWG